MIDHARHCNGYPCTCGTSAIVVRPTPELRKFYCGTCKQQMYREGRGFVHAGNGSRECPDTLEDTEQWE